MLKRLWLMPLMSLMAWSGAETAEHEQVFLALSVVRRGFDLL